MLSKADLRRDMRSRLKELGVTRDEKSRKLCEALVRRPEYQRARTVATFDPLATEPDVSLLWELGPRQFLYPRIVEGQLELFRVDAMSELQETHETLPFREPPLNPERKATFGEIDLILVPGLAFSFDGRRLGRGGGYYDRLLAILLPKTSKLGVCFDFQITFDLPTERHDERVTAVVSA